MSDTAAGISRRALLKGSAVAVGTTTATGAYLVTQSGPALAASEFTANDVVIENTEGVPQTLTIDPTLTLTWDELATAPTEVTFTIKATVENDGSTSTATVANPTKSITTPDTSGDQTFSFNGDEPISLLGGSLPSPSAYEDSTVGDSENTTNTITLVISATLKDDSSNTTIDRTESDGDPLVETSFDVTMDHQRSSSVSSSGSANTGGS